MPPWKKKCERSYVVRSCKLICDNLPVNAWVIGLAGMVMAPGGAVAHSGHGHVDSVLLHQLLSPVHAIPVMLSVGIVLMVALATRKSRNSR